MKSEQNDGGPAFPMPAHQSGNGEQQYPIYGMTLRDYFAAQESLADFDGTETLNLMVEVVGRPIPDGGWKTGNMVEMHKFLADFNATMKYIRADAMLKAREKGHKCQD